MGLFSKREPIAAPDPRRCKGCGQSDDHPRVHSVVPTPAGGHASEFWHHDCFSAVHVDRIDHADIHALAATGLKGDALRALIMGE